MGVGVEQLHDALVGALGEDKTSEMIVWFGIDLPNWASAEHARAESLASACLAAEARDAAAIE